MVACIKIPFNIELHVSYLLNYRFLFCVDAMTVHFPKAAMLADTELRLT